MHLRILAHRNVFLARQSGVTMIELMVVMVIIAIISTVAYPSYTQFVVKSKRGAGSSMLLQVADRQQQFFMDNKQYAAALTDLGFPSDPFMIGDEGSFLASGSADRIYNISLSNVSATTFTATAAPELVQASKDTKCGSLTLTHSGVKGQSGSSNDCW